MGAFSNNGKKNSRLWNKKKNKNIIHNEGAVATVVATVPLLVTFDHTITCTCTHVHVGTYYIYYVYTRTKCIYLCIP